MFFDHPPEVKPMTLPEVNDWMAAEDLNREKASAVRSALRSEDEWKTRALKAEATLASLELVVVCASDIVAAWPKLTMRALGTMTKSIDTLRQALAAIK
jgi:hypothetical protein